MSFLSQGCLKFAKFSLILSSKPPDSVVGKSYLLHQVDDIKLLSQVMSAFVYKFLILEPFSVLCATQTTEELAVVN